LVVGELDERASFPELLSNIGLVLRVPAFDEDSEALGHKVKLVAEPFNQHAGVALDLFDPLVDRIEASIKPLLLPFKALF
jgi:hypothetical protein